jgi:hypothetical protein
LAFANRTAPGRTLLFHHDPLHSDERLDRLGEEAQQRWREIGGRGELALAAEGDEYELPVHATPPSVATA